MDVLEDIAFVEAPFYRENYVWGNTLLDILKSYNALNYQ